MKKEQKKKKEGKKNRKKGKKEKKESHCLDGSVFTIPNVLARPSDCGYTSAMGKT